MKRALAVVCLVAVVASAACGGDDDDDDGEGLGVTTSSTSQPETEAPPSTGAGVAPLADVSMTLDEVAEADAPIALVSRAGSPTLYVAEREGSVRPFDGTTLGDPILDLSDEVVTDVEKGLLDIEFSADGTVLYVHYSIEPDGDTRVVGYSMSGDTVDTGSRRELLAVEQPYDNHNGGSIEIGPDGFLYIALGDGGSSGDPEGNGQDTGAVLGKILRIDPAGATGDEYAIPPDNPFADGSGGAPEVWLYGVRNPWRIAFDPETGDLWLADVGQNAYEEINLLPAADGAGRGANLGWNEMEGNHSYDGGENPEGAVLPIFEVDRSEGACSITGGVVYRGTAIPALAGAYLFTDFCDGRIRALRAEGGQVTDERTFDLEGGDLVSFGTDAAGEVYVLSLEGPIYRLDPA